MRDTVTNGDFAVYNESKLFDCYVGYAEYLRTKIEKAFTGRIDLVNKYCDEKRSETGKSEE